METLKRELKELIIEECEKDMEASEISDGQAIIRGDLDLDSLDVLQICMAIKTQYGVRIEGSGASRKILKNINTLAEYVQAHRTK